MSWRSSVRITDIVTRLEIRLWACSCMMWGSSEKLVSPQLQLELDLCLGLDDRVGEDKGLCGHV